MVPPKTRILKALRATRAKIVEGWTQGTNARDMGGTIVRAEGPLACQWCTVGAFQAAVPDAHVRFHARLKLEESLIGTKDLVGWNDAPGRGKRHVLALFDRAIKKLEAA